MDTFQQYSPDGRWGWDGWQWVAVAPAPAPGPPDVYRLRLRRHLGLLIAWYNTTTTYTGTFEQLQREYRDAQTYCLLLGWWSIVSVLAMNWICLFQNQSAMRQVRQLANRFD